MLPQRLKELRIANNLIHEDMANYLGITRQAYGNYELGKRDVDTQSLIKLADKFNVTVDYLLGRTTHIENIDVYQKNSDTLDFHLFDADGLQFIARSNKELSPAEFKKLQKLIKNATEIFDDTYDQLI